MNYTEIKILFSLLSFMLRKERRSRIALGGKVDNWDKISGAFGNLNQLVKHEFKVS